MELDSGVEAQPSDIRPHCLAEEEKKVGRPKVYDEEKMTAQVAAEAPGLPHPWLRARVYLSSRPLCRKPYAGGHADHARRPGHVEQTGGA